MLPKGLVIPESLKGIIGDVDVSVTKDTGLKINNTRAKGKKAISPVQELNNKTFYIATGINKNIQVIQSNSKVAEYLWLKMLLSMILNPTMDNFY